ncbi:hypothetical protein HPB51_000470 [Rhipicephalus microplus]|uniref:CCHC-type domain-containing protein n=1 Tax=Rhipicephalus microplus TaxID=6941 RepID=A0A9J6EPV2_RHIMP|nr:hypothetical protein HPB51_000470 [Rhipicephalus microplus]
MARSVRGASAAAAGRGVRFPSAPSDYRFLLPTLPSGDSMEECVFLHGDLEKRPYRLEDFRAPLEEVGLIKAIIGIGAFQINHIWLAKMRSKDDKEALLKTGGLRVNGGFCAIIDPIQHDVTVKLHWVDFAVSNESVRQALGEFGEVLEVFNDNWTVAGFEHAISTTRVVRLKLKEGVVLEDLPHLFKIGGGTVLLVAPGRAPPCLRCHMQGHIRRDCQTPRCGVCRAFGHESQDCVRSYARVTKTVLPTDDAQDNLMDAEEAEKVAPGSNAVGPDAAVQATGEETADATTQDGKDSTKESEELAATGGQQDIQESMEEDMGTSGEIATPEAGTKSPEATTGRGKRYRVESTERNLKRPERLWHRVTGAKSKKYALETRSASSSPVRGHNLDA